MLTVAGLFCMWDFIYVKATHSCQPPAAFEGFFIFSYIIKQACPLGRKNDYKNDLIREEDYGCVIQGGGSSEIQTSSVTVRSSWKKTSLLSIEHLSESNMNEKYLCPKTNAWNSVSLLERASEKVDLDSTHFTVSIFFFIQFFIFSGTKA